MNKKSEEDATEITHSIVESVKKRKEIVDVRKSLRKNSDDMIETIIPHKRKKPKKKVSIIQIEKPKRERQVHNNHHEERENKFLPYIQSIAVKIGSDSSKAFKKMGEKLQLKKEKSAR